MAAAYTNKPAGDASDGSVVHILRSQLDFSGSRDLGSGSAGAVASAWWTRDDSSGDSSSSSGGGCSDTNGNNSGALPARVAVAVKRMHGSGSPSAEEADRFAHTLALLQSLRHNNIVQVFGVCTESGGDADSGSEWSRRSLVMELLDTNLADLIQRDARAPCLSDRAKAEILVEIASGLHYLHAHSPPLTHRDVKPSNIGISLAPQLRVKLLDFDAATMDQAVSGRSAMAPARRAGGTAMYEGPELCQPNSPAVGPFNDVFSFALLACELFDQHPLSAAGKKKAPEIIASYQAGHVPPVPDRVPLPLHSLLGRCLQHAHLRRPKIADVVAELRQIKPRLADKVAVPLVEAAAVGAAGAAAAAARPSPSSVPFSVAPGVGTSAQVSPLSIPRCLAHDQPCNFFCTLCKLLRCHVCRMEGGVEQRRGHTTADVPLVETIAPLERDNLIEVRRETEAFANKQKQQAEQKEQLEQQRKAVSDRAALAEAQIDAAFARLHEFVEKRKAAVMEHQRKGVEAATAELDAAAAGAQTLQAQVPQLLAAIDHALAQPPAQMLQAAAAQHYDGFTGRSVAAHYQSVRGALKAVRDAQQSSQQRQQRDSNSPARADWTFDESAIVRELKRFGLPNAQP